MPKPQNLTYLLRALDGASEDQMSCVECEGHLPDYVQAIADGHRMNAEWQAISRHIESCPHCSQEVELLTAMLRNLYEDLPDDPALTALEPDLTFLQPATAPDTAPTAPWWRDTLGRLAIALSAVLDAGWQPALQPVGSGLKSGTAQQTVATLTVPQPGDGYTVQVQIMRASDAQATNADHGTVTVTIAAPEREPLSLDGLTITLSEAGQVIDQQWTDALGIASFTALPVTRLPHLVLTLAAPAVGP